MELSELQLYQKHVKNLYCRDCQYCEREQHEKTHSSINREGQIKEYHYWTKPRFLCTKRKQNKQQLQIKAGDVACSLYEKL